MNARFLFVVGILGVAVLAHGQEPASSDPVAAALAQLSPRVGTEAENDRLRNMLSRHLRERIDVANRSSSAAWATIQDREQWEAFRREKLAALLASLGEMPKRPAALRSLVTGETQGDGFRIRNIVFESRPGLVVTANLYVPEPPRPAMPGILLSHSHHNPKEQGELQDMGMTWARAGCYVLVPDHLGHGERRQHPFVSAADYAGSFQTGRQDYYFRYDTSLQLYLAGESLMGWLVHDLLRGIDLLLAQRGIDAKRIALLGSVAGGGDPAGVAGALDERITCVCPFNFGGPQPETRYPLPADAETSFNYAGGGSWESTRNLYRSAADGFLPWVIVGSTAPRRLIHAHEFAWDGERDPVWKRYQKIWGFYDAADRLAVAHGQGTLTSREPPGSHCNNIGAFHRRQIHEALGRWWGIRVRPEDEYSQRRMAGDLKCLTDEARRHFSPRPLHKILANKADERLAGSSSDRSRLLPAKRRKSMQERWSQLLGGVTSPKPVTARAGSPPAEQRGAVQVTRELLETEPGIAVPLMTLKLSGQVTPSARPVMIAIAGDGIAGVLKRRSEEISGRLAGGWTVAIAEVRGTGLSAADGDRGPQSRLTSQAATCLMLGEALLAGQLRDLRAVWQHIKSREPATQRLLQVLGDSGSQALAADAEFAYPHRVDHRPAAIQSTGAITALLFALFEDDVTGVESHQGLASYRSVLDSPLVQVPLDTIIPGVLRDGDLCDVVAALAPRHVRLSRLVDGRGRAIGAVAAQATYEPATQAYRGAGAERSLEFLDENIR